MDKILSKKLYNFLIPTDKKVKADLIIGFGHFDLRIPEQCATLFNEGFSPRILFTGGVGAGSADFENPEAVEFLTHVKNKYPNIDADNIMIEKESTNTGDNLKFSIDILKEKGIFESINKIILVATPTRQLRVFLTVKKYFPNATLINLPPSSSFEFDMQMNKKIGINFQEHLVGELERITKYPKMGYACSIAIPQELESII